MDPGVVAVEVFRVLRGRKIFVNKNRRRFPGIHLLTNLVPVRVAALGKYEDDRTAIVCEIGLTSGSIGSDIRLVSLVHGVERVIGRAAVIFLGLVVHQRDMESSFAGYVLQQGIAAV